LVGAAFEFDFVGFDGFGGDDDSEWDADEVGVFEFWAWSFVAVVNQDIESTFGEFVCEFKGVVEDAFFVGFDGDDVDGVGGDGWGHDDAIVVVGGFDAGGEGSGDSDAVAAHDDGLFLLIFVEDGEAHGFRIFGAEFEDVADFDASFGFEECALGAWGGVACLGVADVGDDGFFFGGGEVAGPVEAGDVVVFFVGSCCP